MFPVEIQKKIEALYVEDEYGARHTNLKVTPDPGMVEWFGKNYGIRTDVHRMCQVCQIQQIAKYQDAKLKDYDPKAFHPKCNFVTQGLPGHFRERIRQIATEKDIPVERATKIALATIDPVAWAEVMFGFDDATIGTDEEFYLRPYQKEQLRCTARRVVMREGRRVGKTFCMALKLLFLAFNETVKKGRDSSGKVVEKGPEIMIITPFQSQITNIFEEMETLLMRNVDLSKGIISGGKSLYTKTPHYYMRFENGAEIHGFVTGIGTKQDGSGGGTIRGGNANIIYMDEMDMIPDEVYLKVIQPLLLTGKGPRFYATSTPIGKRSFFFNWSTQRPDFKEFYFPSTVLPQWNDMKREIEAESTKESFSAEYLAEFVDASYGVFKPSLVHEARADYTYQDTDEFGFWSRFGVKDKSRLIYCMGIDWNKNAGSEFLVAAYDPATNHFYVVDAINVGASEFSGEKWKETVKQLNYKWEPDYIYADEGYGHTVIEDIRLEASRLRYKKHPSKEDQQTVKLLDRMKSFNFSSSVYLRDPVTRKEIVKPGKFFLVETAVRVFEGKQIHFPEGDSVLLSQLLKYVVLRQSETTGKPVYGPENSKVGDHRLDALLLAIGGIYLERGVYAHGRAVLSAPDWIPAEQAPTQSSYDPREKTNQLREAVKQNKIPGYHSVLEILRGAGAEHNEKILKTYEAEEAVKNGHYRRDRSRGDLEGASKEPPTPPARAFARDEEDLWRAKQMEPFSILPRKKTSNRASQFRRR